MEDMIKKIVDADNEAKAMEEIALREKEELDKKIDDDIKKIYDKRMREALETVKRNDAQEEKQAEKRLEEIRSKQKSAHIKLRSDYERNCDKWVDAIVRRILE